jgi:colicin import membrane protein
LNITHPHYLLFISLFLIAPSLKMRGAGLARFAALMADDDDQRMLGRFNAEQAAFTGRVAADQASARAAAAEKAKLEALKKANPEAYADALADLRVVEKARAEEASKQQAIEKQATNAAAAAAVAAEEKAVELALKKKKEQERARVAELNKLADADPEAYEAELEKRANEAAAAAEAGVELGADGFPVIDLNGPEGMRTLALRQARAQAANHRRTNAQVQSQRRRLRLRVAPLYQEIPDAFS